MENKIAIAYDFSNVSKNALKYAIESTKPEDILEVIHVDTTLLSAGVNDHLKSQISDEIKEYLKLNKLPENLTITILSGNIVSELKTYINKNVFDYLIAGTRDNHNFLERWIGTISLGLVKTLNIPVLLIPRFAFYKKYKKVVVASDFHLTNKALLHQIKLWNKSHGAFVKFLHVRENPTSDFSKESENIVNVLFEKEPADFGFEVASLNSKNVSDSLLSAAYNYNAEVLILISENQSFMNNLLFKSLSKEMIEKSSIPVLFLHN